MTTHISLTDTAFFICHQHPGHHRQAARVVPSLGAGAIVLSDEFLHLHYILQWALYRGRVHSGFEPFVCARLIL